MLKLVYEKVQFDKVLSNDLYILNNKVDKKSLYKKLIFLIKNLTKIIHSSIFYSPHIKKNSKNFNVFYIRTLNRGDIVQNSVNYEKFEGTTVCVLEKKIKQTNPKIIYYSIKDLFKSKKYWLKFFKENKIKLFSYSGFVLLTRLYEVYSQTLKIMPLVIKHKIVVSYQQCQATENMICQLANINKMQTFGLQTSLNIYDQSKNIDFDKFNYDFYKILDYLNPVCKNILCWGSINKSIYISSVKANIHIIGKAGLPEITDPKIGVTIVFEPNDFETTNNELLKISNYLKNNEITVSRWFRKGHPSIKNGALRDGPLRKVIIGFNSTLLAELGFLGMEVYVLKGSNFEKFLPKELSIQKIDDLINNINIKRSYPHEIWKNFIECSGEESIQRYKILLNL